MQSARFRVRGAGFRVQGFEVFKVIGFEVVEVVLSGALFLINESVHTTEAK